ncbi:MAG: hypothetical protein ACI97A_002884 [Planctomycetota bacterium]|jgi:hypothetical protein
MKEQEPKMSENGRPKRQPALSVATRRLMYVLGVGLVPLIANSVYLAFVTGWGFWDEQSHENLFYMWMVLGHLTVGLLLIPVFLAFAFLHLRNTKNHRNMKGKRTGRVLLAGCSAVVITGLLMTLRLLPLDSFGGRATYWLHVLIPILVVLLYIMHRSYGPKVKWRWGMIYAGSVFTILILMSIFHSTDPRTWNARGDGTEVFLPARVRTHGMGLIPEQVLMMDHYCKECHPDAVKDHYESVHHFSSFNNPVYLFSVRETREVLLKRDGHVRGARFCAGCHDPVPLLSGAFDDPNYDILNDKTGKEGVNCTVCHAITNVTGTIGNGNYTIEEPLHYPFAYSENKALQWVNRQLVKAKPAFHKTTFLRPLHKSAEFCAVCHKVNIPKELNHYKDWLRGQNHYDNFLLSGVSGHGARSFYYPKKAEENCNECHMPQKVSDDFGAVGGKIHDHHFPGANTAMPRLTGQKAAEKLQADFLQDGQMDIDIFGIRREGKIDGQLLAPTREQSINLEAGDDYLVEVVLRTLKLGHMFTQGTSDSNEVWIELEAWLGDNLVGKSGVIHPDGKVDPWSHFVNSLLLDRQGNRIERRNVQDIFTALYTNMMPPGTGQVVHYALKLPADAIGVLRINAKLKYRKFDKTLMDYVYSDFRKRGEYSGATPDIPIVVMCEDEVLLPIGSAQLVGPSSKAKKPLWQRWRDYGIGLLLAGSEGSNKGDLRQASLAFSEVAKLGHAVGWLDLARVYEKEGRLAEARDAIALAIKGGIDNPWTANWLTGKIEAQHANYDLAIAAFDRVLNTKVVERGFDFSKDYMVIFEKGAAQYDLARQKSGAERKSGLLEARSTFHEVLELDAENASTHYKLMFISRLLFDQEKAAYHRALYDRYRIDNNARDSAAAIHRKNNPAADKAAESIVIYDLNRKN